MTAKTDINMIKYYFIKIGKHIFDNIYCYLFIISFLMNVSFVAYYQATNFCKDNIHYYSAQYHTAEIEGITKEDTIKALYKFGDPEFAELYYKLRLVQLKDTLNGWIEVNQGLEPWPFN